MRVLVVEDQRKIAAFLKRGLEEEGYAVDLAFDGDEALNLAESAPYDLIVLDIILPKRDGLAVCRALRLQGNRVPILMLTARDTVEDRIAGLDSGADDYLTKPFAFGEFLARVRALRRRGSDRSTPELHVADLVLDPGQHEVRRGGRIVLLTLKEYAILEYLLQQPGRVATRTMIAEHVWGYDFESESNVIDVHIRSLRKKLDDGGDQPLIQTVRGVGYKVRR
ncbi:MAG: response regulator transcription factor [Dehalococcoidia bacterium]